MHRPPLRAVRVAAVSRADREPKGPPADARAVRVAPDMRAVRVAPDMRAARIAAISHTARDPKGPPADARAEIFPLRHFCLTELCQMRYNALEGKA